MKKHLTLLGVAAMATAVFAGCSNDEILESYQGEEISFRTRIETRATELTKGTLGDFSVIAKGMHTDGTIYDAYLIGGEEGGYVVADNAKKTSESIWELDHKVFWPTDMEKVLFWAYTTKSASDDKALPTLNTSVTFSQNDGGPKIVGFSPAQVDLTSNGNGNGYWQDGDYQKDLLIAFTQQKKSEGTSVPLYFNHALSQINIKAVQKNRADTDHRVVKIKGAWVVNVKTQGDMTAGFQWDKETTSATEKPEWANIQNLGHYGSYYSSNNELTTSVKPILGSQTNEGSLMIIPQEVKGWNKNDNTDGAFILLLCRVELKHPGTTHDGGAYDGKDIHVEGGFHYHQQFPVNSKDEYDATEYGFTCVPLDATWEMGKRYTYTLDICGETTGAGIYPPDGNYDAYIPEAVKNDIKIVARPEGKNPNDLVLDDPIQFKVEVNPWTDASTDFNGDISMK